MKIRTFIGVEISEGLRRNAVRLAQKLDSSGAKTNWVDPQNLHWTLKFLGDADETVIPDICDAVMTAAAPLAPFDIASCGAGAFPDGRRPRTLWIGVGRGADQFIALHDTIDDALAPLGFRPEGRRFQPHLTIGRVRGHGPGIGRLIELLDARHDFDGGAMRVSEVVVFASQLGGGGPVYTALGRAPLTGNPPS